MPPSPAIPTRTVTISTTVFRATAATPLPAPSDTATDLRLTKLLRLGERHKINLIAESFNLLNRDNQRVTITANGLVNNATTFVTNSVGANITLPGYYQLPTNFMKPTAAYVPRQVQLSLKFIY